MYKRNIEVHLRKHCYCREAVGECVHSRSYLAFDARAAYYIVICGLSGSTIFFH
jgi:hypothetical protein